MGQQQTTRVRRLEASEQVINSIRRVLKPHAIYKKMWCISRCSGGLFVAGTSKLQTTKNQSNENDMRKSCRAWKIDS